MSKEKKSGKVPAGVQEQPEPNGKGREIGKLVIEDIEARIAKGVETYGEPLKAHNGRNSIIDAYHEALDLAIYLRQHIEEELDTPLQSDIADVVKEVDSLRKEVETLKKEMHYLKKNKADKDVYYR